MAEWGAGVGPLDSSAGGAPGACPMWRTRQYCVQWHRHCRGAPGLSHSSTGGTAIKHVLIASILIAASVSTSTAGPGDFNVTIGGITRPQQGNGVVIPSQNRQIDKPQIGGLSVPDTSGSNRRTDIPPAGGSSLSLDTKNSLGWSTLSSGSTGLGGAFSGGGTVGQPSSQFCSTNEVTVGEATQGRTHCSNTVNGTLKQ